jgi:RHS repeat-associated protein
LGRVYHQVETAFGDSISTDYRYDEHGRLWKVSFDGVLTHQYGYDANGNRLSVDPSGTVIASYDNQDRMKTYNGASYEYGPNGERRKRINADGSVDEYQYDALGNLVHIVRASGVTVDYVVDAFNRRIAKKKNGVIVARYLYRNGLSPVAVLDGSGALAARFVYASHRNTPDFMVLANGTVYKFLSDELGSPIAIANTATGALAQFVYYDEFGIQNILANNVLFPSWVQPFGFAGGLYDEDTGLVRFGARDYEAETGRWLAKDPILFRGGQANLYVYAGNDPVNRVDSTGFYTEVVFWEPVGWAYSSFGHVSIDVDGTSYSWGPGGMDIESAQSYAARNQEFRSGRGLILGLSYQQEAELKSMLSSTTGKYNAFKNNCTDPIERGLAGVGARDSQLNSLLPSGLAHSLSNLAIGQTSYSGPPDTRSLVAPWSSGVLDSLRTMY